MTTRTILVIAVAVVVAAGLLAGSLVQGRAGGRRYRWLLAPLYRASRAPAIAVLLLAALPGLRGTDCCAVTARCSGRRVSEPLHC
ncbi:hypothetical protein FHG89_26980 [Micromonospora orduensis]|uniref:Uncharacterized protein n=1 Tax=Micromonospora orduensis TaxID=1420891 RepID=A0A5C4QCR1_9ACTN|nr:hypothetical protein [Micromonospora orduensis]TNH23499.1 hypothetical protein FHG89_26980 [Micromonospora orduensis]